MNEKEMYIRELKVDIGEKRLNHTARAVIIPDKNLYNDEKLINALNNTEIKAIGENILRNKESEDREVEGLINAKEHLAWAQDAFNLLGEIERILDNKEQHGRTQVLLAESAIQIEFVKLFHSILRVYRNSCATSFEREKYIKNDNLVLLARSKGLAKNMPKDFVKTWKQNRVSSRKGQARTEQLLTYFKENKDIYSELIKELEIFLTKNSNETSETKGMNCF